MLRTLILVAAVAAVPVHAAEVNIWSDNYDNGSIFQTTGPFPWSSLSINTVDGFVFADSGSVPGFGSKYLHKSTNTATTFSVTGLGSHTALRFKFDLLFQDSWDSIDGVPGVTPDILFVDINGTTYEWTVASASGTINDVGPGTIISTGTNLVGSSWNDTVVSYDLLIPHVSDSFVASFRFGGAGFQGGTDESWGIDNFSLSAITADGGVPEPATWVMLIAGFGLVGVAARRRAPVRA